MPTRFSVVLNDDRARDVQALAHEYDLTEEKVLRQLLELGLDALEDNPPVEGRAGRDVTGNTDTDL